jgi:hypothetical protein
LNRWFCFISGLNTVRFDIIVTSANLDTEDGHCFSLVVKHHDGDAMDEAVLSAFLTAYARRCNQKIDQDRAIAEYGEVRTAVFSIRWVQYT